MGAPVPITHDDILAKMIGRSGSGIFASSAWSL
jgi:hypothetical protein